MKATRGVIITVLKYDYYQDPKNYEGNDEETTKGSRRKSGGSTKNKNDKNVKNYKNIVIGKTPITGKNYIDYIIACFIQEYKEEHGDEYLVTSPGKEREFAGKLAGIYKKKYPNASSEEAISGLVEFFKIVMKIKDDWLYNHMSLSIIVSKFNEIKLIIKNGNQRKKSGATGGELAEHFAKKWTEE